MNARKIALALAAGTTMLIAAPAFAQPPHWAPAHGWRAKQHHHHHYQHQHYAQGYGYRAPAYAYYRPRPVYVPPPVVYYPPPRPVIYGHIPLDHGTRIGFALGL
jgi:hypothetical protein